MVSGRVARSWLGAVAHTALPRPAQVESAPMPIERTILQPPLPRVDQRTSRRRGPLPQRRFRLRPLRRQYSRNAWLENAGLLGGDGLNTAAEEGFMVEI